MWKTAFQAEGRAWAKTLWWECAQRICATADWPLAVAEWGEPIKLEGNGSLHGGNCLGFWVRWEALQGCWAEEGHALSSVLTDPLAQCRDEAVGGRGGGSESREEALQQPRWETVQAGTQWQEQRWWHVVGYWFYFGGRVTGFSDGLVVGSGRKLVTLVCYPSATYSWPMCALPKM